MTKIRGRVSLWVAAGSVAVLVAGGALAAAHMTQEQRVKQMKTMGGHMGAIGKVVKGEAAYSAETVTHAEGLEKMSHEVLDWFPEGSIGGEKSRAKPEIWSDWDDFKSKVSALQKAVPTLVAATKTGDTGQIGAALKEVGKTCGGCHKPFRKPKKDE